MDYRESSYYYEQQGLYGPQSVSPDQPDQSEQYVPQTYTAQPAKSTNYAYEPVLEASTHRTKTWKQKHMSGWRFGASLFAVTALVVLIANIGITIYAVREYGGSVTADFKPVFTGDCGKTKSLNTWLHLTINVLSSVLLAGSNYCMQVLTAPSRKDVSILRLHN
jgi:hypothetical protein